MDRAKLILGAASSPGKLFLRAAVLVLFVLIGPASDFSGPLTVPGICDMAEGSSGGASQACLNR
jgi:hypothetical protein